MHLYHDANTAKINGISQYSLTSPALSYAIVDAKITRSKNFNNRGTSTNYENTEYDIPENIQASIQLYCIQTKYIFLIF